MTNEITTQLWAEAGEWERGEPALVIMHGQFDEHGQIIDTPDMLHDVPLADAADEDGWDTTLRGLGYRRTGVQIEYTDYGVAFPVESLDNSQPEKP